MLLIIGGQSHLCIVVSDEVLYHVCSFVKCRKASTLYLQILLNAFKIPLASSTGNLWALLLHFKSDVSLFPIIEHIYTNHTTPVIIQ